MQRVKRERNKSKLKRETKPKTENKDEKEGQNRKIKKVACFKGIKSKGKSSLSHPVTHTHTHTQWKKRKKKQQPPTLGLTPHYTLHYIFTLPRRSHEHPHKRLSFLDKSGVSEQEMDRQIDGTGRIMIHHVYFLRFGKGKARRE